MLKRIFFLQQVSLGKSGFKAVNDVSFKLYDGETLGW
jgi:ABC-type oligopeptide transport system ATPase subunit